MNLNTCIYLIEVSLLTSIFYLFYRYLYFKLAYFEWSRYYLYTVLILSLIIPLLPGLYTQGTTQHNIFQLFNFSNQGTVNGLIKVNKFGLKTNNSFWVQIPYVKILLIIWISGIARFTLIIAKNIFSVKKLIKTGEKINAGKFKIIKNDFVDNVFSFFNFIFINKNFKQLTEEEQEQILNHEKIHARQFHSIDNIIFEIYRAVFWFNPVSKLIAADIKIIHEFITDNIITNNRNKPNYSRLILKLSTQDNVFKAASNFSKEEIKNRIKIISFPEKEKIRKKRFIISIPVLIITIFASWFIISSANSFIKIQKPENKPYLKPFDENNYKIISPYFKDKEYKQLIVSHEEVSYEIKSFSNIYAIESGIISNIKTKDVFGLKEITISENLNTKYTTDYSGLYQAFVMSGDSVKKGSIIGKSGDIRLYPTITIKLSKNGETFNPEKFY